MTELSIVSNIIQEPILKEVHVECVFPKDMEQLHRQEFVELVHHCIKDIGAGLFDKNTVLAIDTKTKVYSFKFDGVLVRAEENHYHYHLRFKYYK